MHKDLRTQEIARIGGVCEATILRYPLPIRQKRNITHNRPAS
jgi:hypothetical protein